ncbi:transcriptional repressor [filamentous cyanobacterium CCP5]|nr:transcriptional repressor [filamentous cyanobacterium CCP5]
MGNYSRQPHSVAYSEVLRALLNKRGLRITSQRQKILDILKDIPAGEHLSAEEIYQNLLEQGENVGISTVYRALHLMVDLGFLRELGLAEGKRYYELNQPFTEQHHHLVCIQCGSVQEFQEDLITQIGTQEAEERGFSLMNCQFSVLALCPVCQVELDN